LPSWFKRGCKVLGEHGYKAFMRAKRREWDEYRLQVSQWEWNRYFEVV